MRSEQRFNCLLRAEIRKDTLEGHAIIWDAVAEILPGMFETVRRSAMDGRTDDDAVALINHDRNLLLGRTTAGTLRASLDSEGLAFEVKLPRTTYADDLRISHERGDISGMSFGALPGVVKREKTPDGQPLEVHTKFERWLDVSIVTYPAYDGPVASLRHRTWESSPVMSARERFLRTRHRLIERQSA